MTRPAPVVRVENLRVQFDTEDGVVRAVDGVSFDIGPGETLGLVGESGSGKSVTGLAMMGLIPVPPGRIADGGRILLGDRDLLSLPRYELRRIRGNEISMIFQEPMTSLNPVFTIGDQIAEAAMLHRGQRRREALAAAREMLELVQVPDPARVARSYPHQLSGGMRQRAMIAMALCCDPKLLIADEPTTALDVTTQAQIVELLRRLQRELGTAILFITHNLGVVAEIAERVLVMYAGRVVEGAPVSELFARPRMPYTAALLEAIPHLDRPRTDPGDRLESISGTVPDPLAPIVGCAFAPRCAHAAVVCRDAEAPLEPVGAGRTVRCHRWQELDLAPGRAACRVHSPETSDRRKDSPSHDVLVGIEDLVTTFPLRGGLLYRVIANVAAVRGVSFDIRRGEVLGLVGESGSGKTTLGHNILRLVEPTAGRVTFDGRDLTNVPPTALKPFRREMQIVFQDPYGSLNPRMTVQEILSEPYTIHGLARGARRSDLVAALLERVGLSADQAGRYPHEFSGGQRQRIGIARALAVQPSFLVADEPVSSLDVSIQAQILNLFADLRADLGLTILFITHDLGVIAYLADRVAVMYLGRIVELGPTGAVYGNPVHPYTEALLSAVPGPNPARRQRRMILEGEVPNPAAPPSGCAFRTRCPIAVAECARIDPPLKEVSPGHFKACIRR